MTLIGDASPVRLGDAPSSLSQDKRLGKESTVVNASPFYHLSDALPKIIQGPTSYWSGAALDEIYCDIHWGASAGSDRQLLSPMRGVRQICRRELQCRRIGHQAGTCPAHDCWAAVAL